MAELLLSYGADKNFRLASFRDQTIVELATQMQNKAAIELLSKF